MCLAVPMKIIEITENTALVLSGDHKHEVNLSLVKEAKTGDYILAHGNIAINKVSEEEAEKIIKLVGELNSSLKNEESFSINSLQGRASESRKRQGEKV